MRTDHGLGWVDWGVIDDDFIAPCGFFCKADDEFRRRRNGPNNPCLGPSLILQRINVIATAPKTYPGNCTHHSPPISSYYQRPGLISIHAEHLILSPDRQTSKLGAISTSTSTSPRAAGVPDSSLSYSMDRPPIPKLFARQNTRMSTLNGSCTRILRAGRLWRGSLRNVLKGRTTAGFCLIDLSNFIVVSYRIVSTKAE